jgi:hypothetical protein
MDTGYWGHSKMIANAIVNHFGGMADYNDCDDIEIDYARSQHDSTLKT